MENQRLTGLKISNQHRQKPADIPNHQLSPERNCQQLSV